MTNMAETVPIRMEWPKILLILSLLLVVIFYAPDADLLWTSWMELEEFSHGPLMLAVSLFLLWSRRSLLNSPDDKGRLFGIIIVVISIMMYSLAIKAGILNARHLSALMIVFGIFLSFGGFTYARYVLPALILLPFVVPSPKLP